MQESLEYFGGDELPASVFVGKYALENEKTPDDMHWRMAAEIERIERQKFKKPYSKQYIYSLLKEFETIIPQGSVMSSLGNPSYVSLSNCYVAESPTDSYGGIHKTDEQVTQISKRRGGVGLDISAIRPAEFPTQNAARSSTGIVPFMERYSASIREVGQSGRRGALLVSICVHHPQVEEFAKAKLDLTKVTGANISVRLSDEFLEAVAADKEYEQRFPVTGKPQFSRMVPARKVWRTIIECAHRMAEPGLLFWDNILRESPADCYASLGFATVSTNPCSELPLCELDSCRLLLLNLFGFIKKPFTKEATFDFKKFYEYSQIAQRLMDDIVDLEEEAVQRIISKIEADPEDAGIKYRELELWKGILEKCQKGRRTGTGITALGDVFAALGIKYGSEESIALTDKIYLTLKLGCYRASVDMAKELGPFPIWNASLEKDCRFLNRIKDESLDLGYEKINGASIWKDMQKYGRRNIALLTTAPAGSVSILAGPAPYFGTTSGIEPLFTDKPYIRRKKINHADKEARVDFVDQNGDKWSEYKVYHAKIKQWMDITEETDPARSPYHGSCANDIDWKQRVKLQAAAQKHVDHSISSTINLPENVGVETVAEIYETAWKAGCKGITVYRDKCRTGVLVNETNRIAKTQAPKRPKNVPCDIHHLSVQKLPYVVAVGVLDNDPYEIFAFAGNNGYPEKGLIHKVKRGQYQLLDLEKRNLLNEGESLSGFLNGNEEALARMVSTSLRHGTDISFVTQQLEKVKGDLHIFAKALARVLKKYVKDGTKVTGEKCEKCGQECLVRQEGCATCKGCGWSKCS